MPGIGGVFSSPLGRAVTTATACARRLGLPVTAIQDLAEVPHGAMADLTGSEIEPGSR